MKSEFPFGNRWCRVVVLLGVLAVYATANGQVAGDPSGIGNNPGPRDAAAGYFPATPQDRSQDLPFEGRATADRTHMANAAEAATPRSAAKRHSRTSSGSGVLQDQVPGPAQASGNTPAVPEVAQAGELMAFSTLLTQGAQQVVVIDASRRTMSVYHILPETGEITLVSVRNIRLDSSIDYFNTGNPSPEDIRKMHTP